MSRTFWRWEERDFGFRFRAGTGRDAREYYQARMPGSFYIVPASQRKFTKDRMEKLATLANAPASPRVVANPWRYYGRHWDWIVAEDGVCFNWAGCLEMEEIHRREDEGVQRAMDLVAELLGREDAVPLSQRLVKQVHVEMMGAIYPFAGEWRTVALHKGEGPTKWPLPSEGIQPLIDVLKRDVFARSPFITDDDDEVFRYASEVMNELLALHPFREGNGRTAFIVGNLILMQNDMLPLAAYERRTDEARFYDACEAGRISKNYVPLATLLTEWEDRALTRWREAHG